MSRHSEETPDWETQRNRIIGLGETSIRKSYFPELQQRIQELEKKTEDQTAVEEQLRQQFDETLKKEKELRASEERFRSLIASSPVPIMLAREGIFIYTNPAFCRMTGYHDPDELVGKRLLDLIAPEYREQIAGYIHARSAGKPAENRYEAVGIRRDGTRFPYDITIAVIDLSDGPVTMAFVTETTERKAAEAALAKSSSSLKRAEIIAGIGHWEFHMDTRLVYASDGARSIYGMEGDQWTIPEVQKIPLPEYRKVLDDALAALIREGRPYDVEFRIRRPSDNGIFDIRSIAEYDPNSQVVFGVIQDITDRKRNEATIRESEAFLSSIVENIPLMLFVKDAQDLRFVRFNKAGEDLLGHSRDEMIGKSDHDFFPKEQADFFTATDRHVLSGKIPVDIPEETINTRYLGPRIIHTRKIPILGTQGESRFLLGMSEDITERKAAEEALRLSEERYRSLVDITDTGYLVLDDKGFVIDANDVYVRLTGRNSKDELIGHQVTEWTAPHDLDRNSREIERSIETGIVRGFEVDYVKPDGTIQPVEINATVFHGKGGDVILTICRDISERKKTSVALQQARNKLTLLNAVTFQDIQTAAFSLSAYQELVRNALTDNKAKAYLEKQELFLKKMVETLQFARNYQEMGMHPPRWQNFRQVFLYAISHLDFLPIKQDIRIGNLEVFADPLLEKAIFNIMQNVLHHGGNASEVRLSFIVKDDVLTLIIEDNGIGIPVEEKNMIFDRGYGKGSGLGLFLVREVLSITGMTIRETGQYGNGTRFEVSIPKGAYRFPDLKER